MCISIWSHLLISKVGISCSLGCSTNQAQCEHRVGWSYLRLSVSYNLSWPEWSSSAWGCPSVLSPNYTFLNPIQRPRNNLLVTSLKHTVWLRRCSDLIRLLKISKLWTSFYADTSYRGSSRVVPYFHNIGRNSHVGGCWCATVEPEHAGCYQDIDTITIICGHLGAVLSHVRVIW